MSYILDALKKSEQQRQRSKGGSIHAPMIAPYAEKSNSLLFYALIATIFIGLALLAIIFQPWRQETAPAKNNSVITTVAQPQIFSAQAPNIQATNIVTSPIIKPIAVQTPVPTIAPAVKIAKPISKETIKLPPTKRVEVAQEDTASKTNQKEISTTQAVPAINDASEKPTPKEELVSETHSNEISLHNRLLEMSELPQEIQQDIPDISIAGYVFSDNPKERSVGINGRLLQEGDYLKQGIRLERIAPEGLIFSYKNFHFRQSLQ